MSALLQIRWAGPENSWITVSVDVSSDDSGLQFGSRSLTIEVFDGHLDNVARGVGEWGRWDWNVQQTGDVGS